jgi:uncharacterized membrane protein
MLASFLKQETSRRASKWENRYDWMANVIVITIAVAIAVTVTVGRIVPVAHCILTYYQRRERKGGNQKKKQKTQCH